MLRPAGPLCRYDSHIGQHRTVFNVLVYLFRQKELRSGLKLMMRGKQMQPTYHFTSTMKNKPWLASNMAPIFSHYIYHWKSCHILATNIWKHMQNELEIMSWRFIFCLYIHRKQNVSLITRNAIMDERTPSLKKIISDQIRRFLHWHRPENSNTSVHFRI